MTDKKEISKTAFVHPGATFVIKRDLIYNSEKGLLMETDGSELKPGAVVMVGSGNSEAHLASLQELAKRLVNPSSNKTFSEWLHKEKSSHEQK